jgi:hypothetical protein
MANAQKRVVVMATYDLPSVLQFLGSVAMAVAVQSHTVVEWRDYNDSKVLNAVYSVFAWKQKPGFVEIDQDWKKITAHRNQLWMNFTKVFFNKASSSPVDAAAYLEDLERIKAHALEATRQSFSDAARINADIAGEVGNTIRALATIKAGAVIVIAVTTGGLAIAGSAGLAASASTVGCVTSIGLSMAKNLQEAKTAQVIAVDIGGDSAKATGQNYAVQPFAEGAVRWLLTRPGTIEAASKIGLFQHTSGAVQEYARQLANARTPAKRAKLQGRLDMRRAGAGHLAARSIPVIFAISDVIGAVQEYQSDTAGL